MCFSSLLYPLTFKKTSCKFNFSVFYGLLFKTNLSEITSISLEDDLKFEKNLVVGQFIVSGEYKMNDTSVNTEPFIYNLPVEISIDEKYNLDNSTIEVSDFYYEIIR